MSAVSPLRPEAYLSAVEYDQARVDVARIAKGLRARRVFFVFGAGMSIPSGLPSFGKIAREVIQTTWYPHARGLSHDDRKATDGEIERILAAFPIESILQAATLESSGKYSEIHECIRSLIEKTEAGHVPETHAGHDAMATVVQECGIYRLYTTNYDTLIERALNTAGETVALHNIRELDTLIDARKFPVIHLHGTLDDHPLFCEADLHRTNEDSVYSMLFQPFISDFTSLKVPVFIGYSLSDPNIRILLRRLHRILESKDFHFGKKIYIVYPFPWPPQEKDKDAHIRKIAADILQAQDFSFVPLDAIGFFQMLLEEYQKISHADWLQEIAQRINMTDQSLSAKVKEVSAVFPDLAEDDVLSYVDTIGRSLRR